MVSYNEGRLDIRLENEPGPNHSNALALQDQEGENFLFKAQNNGLIDIRNKTNYKSTLVGCRKMAQAAALMEAELGLAFHPRRVIFAACLPCLEVCCGESQEGKLMVCQNTVLICAGAVLLPCHNGL